jgi:hypothetical protein
MTQTIVYFWPDRRPFLGLNPYPAIVVSEPKSEGAPHRLRVDNPRTKRHFFVEAVKSDGPAPGRWTEEATSKPKTAAPAQPAPAAAPQEAPAESQPERAAQPATSRARGSRFGGPSGTE